MFFPIRTDRPLRRLPLINVSLIALNVLIYLLGQGQEAQPAANPFLLLPLSPALYQFITYQFLHDGASHLLGNMVFLYVFGNSVEDRLGRLGYLAFYLGGGVVAGLGHVLTDWLPVMGASGSVSAVTGAFLILFPRSRVTLLIIAWAVEVSGVVLIGFQMAWDAIMQLMGGGSTAYMAHLSGYGYGIGCGLLLILGRLLPREPWDIFAVIEHRRRRRAFRRLTSAGYSPWAHEPEMQPSPAAPPSDEPTRRHIADLRHRISQHVAQRELEPAAAIYRELLAVDSGQTLPRPQQLELANHLMGRGAHEPAARAYELFLSTYATADDREQVELILALLYTRYLGRRQRARELLNSALRRLRDPEQQRLARQMLAEIAES